MSDNLALTQLVQSQANKEVTINDQAAELDAALTDFLSVDLSGASSPLALTDAQALRAMVLKLVGTHPGGAFTVEVPATKKLYVVWNTSGGVVTVAIPGGSGVEVESGTLTLVYADGTDVHAIASGSGGVAGGGGFPVFKGALIKRTTNVAISDSVQTVLGWEGEVYDTDGFADLGTEATRLTVPSGQGITRVQVLCGVQWGPNASGDRWVEILKNGIEVDGMPGYLGPTDGNNRSRIALASAPIAVSDGDHFECRVWQDTGGSLDVEADPRTWFAIVALEFAAFRGALVRLTAAEAVATSADMSITWDAAVYDTDGFWSAGDPTRLTVPAGVSRVRLRGNLNWTFGGTGYRHIWLHKNGALFFGTAKESDAGDAGVQNVGTAVVDVTAGDDFELIARQTSGATKNVAADELSWLAIEVVE